MNAKLSRLHAGLLSAICLLFMLFHTLSLPALNYNPQIEKLYMRDGIEIEITGYLKQKSETYLDAFINEKKRSSEQRPPD